MVWAYSASQRTSSSSTPSASATIRTASPNTPGALRGHRLQVGVVDRLAEADRLLGGGRVVERGVGGLVDGDLVDAVADARRDDGQLVDVARADAGAEHGRAALLAGLGDPVAAVALVVAGDERRRRDDVHARRQDADEFVDVDPHRVVDDDVGLQGQQRVDVVGGRDAQRLDAAQFADVEADLVR